MSHDVVIPTPADVAAIAATADPALRNVLITQGYQNLARAMRAGGGSAGGSGGGSSDGANWCAFATWASRQAGRTIRGEDLQRALRSRLDATPELQPLMNAVVAAARETGTAATAVGLVNVIAEAVAYEGVLRRAADAVADGNRKVFAEIGALFAGFLHAQASPDPAAMQSFLDSMPPGDPPDGQGMLREAFTASCSPRTPPQAERGRRPPALQRQLEETGTGT